MAKKNKNNGSPTPQGSDNRKGKMNGFLFGLLAFLVATIIMVAVVGGAFYYVFHNNIGGLGEKYRSNLQSIPVLKLALPPQSEKDAVKTMTQEELQKKTRELMAERDELKKSVEALNKQVTELNKIKDAQDKVQKTADSIKKNAESLKKQVDAEKAQLAADRKAINTLIAKGDKEGFKQYFEKVDKATAEKIYADIISEQKVSDDALKFTKRHEDVEPDALAEILEQMGDKKLDLIVEILKNMKKEVYAEVIAAMTPQFAAKVVERMSKQYIDVSKG